MNVTAGMRYDRNNEYGGSYSPRIGLTKAFKKFHAKALYSKAFRAPGIQNIQDFEDPSGLANKIKPERTTVIEAELGYLITEDLSILVNIFDIVIKDPIVYRYEPGNEAYVNYDRTGTRGIETEIRYREKWGYINLSYSFSMVNENKVDSCRVYDFQNSRLLDEDLLLGMAAHKASLNSHFNIWKGLSINPSFIFLSKRYGYSRYDSGGVPLIKEFAPAYFLNLFLYYRDLIVTGLNAGIGMYNILDDDFMFIVPYSDIRHAPLPGPSRELLVQLKYQVRL
ncbi:MAG: TonB-dependent receptor [bacterium]|nr:TonB-dependent receptor [bacterium]